MIGFLLSGIMGKVLAAAGAQKSRVETLAEEMAAEHPEFGPWKDAMMTALRNELDTSLNEATLNGLVAGAIGELATKHPGFNRHTFGGG